MAQLFIPQPQDLLGTAAKIAQIKQGQQRLDLMGQQAQQTAEQLELKKKSDEIESAVKALGIQGQDESFYQAPIKTLERLGVVSPGFRPSGERLRAFQKSVAALYQRTLKEPGFKDTSEFKMAIQHLRTSSVGQEEMQARLDLLNKDIADNSKTQAENFMSLLQGSGGIAEGQEGNLLSAFSRAGGTAPVRAAATTAEDRRLEVAKAKADIGKTQADTAKTVSSASGNGSGSESPHGKLLADKAQAIASGAPPEVIAGYDNALRATYRDDAEKSLDKEYGSQTVQGGFVVDPERHAEYNIAKTLLDDYPESTPQEAAAKSASEARKIVRNVRKTIKDLMAEGKLPHEIAPMLIELGYEPSAFGISEEPPPPKTK